jgi:hypothetical protein
MRSMEVQNETPMLDFVLERLSARKRSLQVIADGSRVPYDTLTKIAQRKTRNPGVMHVEALNKYFREHEDA